MCFIATWVKGEDGKRHRAFKCMFCGKRFIESVLVCCFCTTNYSTEQFLIIMRVENKISWSIILQTEHELKCKEEHEKKEEAEIERRPSFTERLKGYLHGAKEMLDEAKEASTQISSINH